MTLAEALAIAERDDLQYREAAKVLAEEVRRLNSVSINLKCERDFWWRRVNELSTARTA